MVFIQLPGDREGKLGYVSKYGMAKHVFVCVICFPIITVVATGL